MPEMTNLQVREYLEGGGRTVLVPVGSTEDHGDHGPLWTDVYIPLEVCKRAAEELDALVGPPVPFGLAPDHRGASGIIYVRIATFISMLRDICVSLSEAGFERIALVNGHYVNTTAMQYAAAEMFDDLPQGVRVFPFAYWQGLQPEQAEAYLSGSAGLHANVGETSAVLAIDPELCDMERVRDFVPELDGFTNHPLALLDPVFLSTPGFVLGAARGGRRRLGQSERVDGREGRAIPPVGRVLGRQPRARHGDDARPDRTRLRPLPAAARVITIAILGGGFMGGLPRGELSRPRRPGASQDDRLAPERPGELRWRRRSTPS